MRRLLILLIFVSLFSGCVASYLEEAAFLELPFEYEGKLDSEEFNPEWDVHWVVPDNSDPGGLYIYAWSNWAWMNYLYYYKDGIYWSIFSPSDSRRIASFDEQGWFGCIYGSGPAETLDINYVDIPSHGWGAYTDGITTNSTISNSIITAVGETCLIGNADSGFLIDAAVADYGNAQFGSHAALVPSGTIPLANVITAAYPEANPLWGPVTVDLLAFAPALTGSYDGKHKFIIARDDALSGARKTVLVSIDSSIPDFSTRQINADRDFYFVSRDRFVGMDGNTLKIFNSDGDMLKSFELENMRLLGYRSSTEKELVFMYVSDERNGDRVCGFYSLPAAFIQEVRE